MPLLDPALLLRKLLLPPRQSRGNSHFGLENTARRIRARAARRCGELLQQYDARGGDQSKSEAPLNFANPSRTEAAKTVGMSHYQQRSAMRLASIPKDQFESEVERNPAPGTGKLARLRPKRSDSLFSRITPSDLRDLHKGLAKAPKGSSPRFGSSIVRTPRSSRQPLRFSPLPPRIRASQFTVLP